MITFRNFLSESAPVGKRMGDDLYVHKDYVEGHPGIPADIHAAATAALKKNHPEFKPNFKHTIVKYNKKSKNISFLYSPDWDTAHEPHIKDSVLVKPDGTSKYSAPKKDPQIYHKKHEFVGADYKGFDIERSKKRQVQYSAAVEKVKKLNNDPKVSSKIGYKSYWDKEVVPHIKND